MDRQVFQGRTRELALRVIRMVDALPRSRAADVIARQVVRSATSVGANYRAACRAKSPADFINKLKIVEEEADETHYWLELIVDADMLPRERVAALLQEADEIVAMTVASIKTAHSRHTRARSNR